MFWSKMDLTQLLPMMILRMVCMVMMNNVNDIKIIYFILSDVKNRLKVSYLLGVTDDAVDQTATTSNSS